MRRLRAQEIFAWILQRIQVNSQARLVRDWVRNAVVEMNGLESGLLISELVDDSFQLVAGMLSREQVRVAAEGIQKFEMIGADDPVLKGFSVPLPDDLPELTARRQRALLADPVKQTLLRLTPGQFEALWALIVKYLGGKRFVLKGKSGDGGIDFTAEFNVYNLSQSLQYATPEWLNTTESRSTVAIIGQAKHWPNQTLPPAVLRELAGTMYLHSPDTNGGERKGSIGMLVTTGRFSSRAGFQARAAGIILLDGEWVASAIVNFGLGISQDAGNFQFLETLLLDQIDQALACIQ